jgi:hypothetical protein
MFLLFVFTMVALLACITSPYVGAVVLFSVLCAWVIFIRVHADEANNMALVTDMDGDKSIVKAAYQQAYLHTEQYQVLMHAVARAHASYTHTERDAVMNDDTIIMDMPMDEFNARMDALDARYAEMEITMLRARVMRRVAAAGLIESILDNS